MFSKTDVAYAARPFKSYVSCSEAIGQFDPDPENREFNRQTET